MAHVDVVVHIWDICGTFPKLPVRPLIDDILASDSTALQSGFLRKPNGLWFDISANGVLCVESVWHQRPEKLKNKIRNM